MTGLLIVCGVLCACTIAVLAIVVRADLEKAPQMVPGAPVSAGGPYDFDFDALELPPCGMRLVLTEEQVEQSFAEIEKNFTVKPRENR